MSATLTSIDALIKAGLADPHEKEALDDVASRYAVAITQHLAERIETAGSGLSKQFVPDPRELLSAPEESLDPIGDHVHSPVEGIVHRYPDRVLLKAVHVCPVYCRFCFRREMVGPAGDGLLTGEKLQNAISYIREREDIWEVILTGGDPLILSPARLRAILEPLRDVEHVKVLRIHSRVPLLDPARITKSMIDVLKQCGKTVYVAVHANHPDEFSDEGKSACARLGENGITLVSQSVLLKGVNDQVETLARLMRLFVENRIKPYYLHHPDLARGTAHFRLSVEEGQALVSQLRHRLSGLCQPTYMLDIPGGHGKAVINKSEYDIEEGCLRVKGQNGERHSYPVQVSASENATVSRKG